MDSPACSRGFEHRFSNNISFSVDGADLFGVALTGTDQGRAERLGMAFIPMARTRSMVRRNWTWA
jgi:hypothetical protein